MTLKEAKKKIISFKELPNYKKSNIGFLIGCGISVKNITKEQWKVIKSHDMWSLNDFHYHPIIPDFYHVELKSRRHLWNQIFQHVHEKKIKEYENVKFIVNKDHCDHILPRLGNMKYIFGYPRIVRFRNQKHCEIYKDHITHSNQSSITAVLDLMYKMKYKKIILFGVDLNTSAYFWTDTNEYGITHINTNENKPINEEHATAKRVKEFIPNFSKLHKIPIYVGYKETLLYPSLKYIDILEEI